MIRGLLKGQSVEVVRATVSYVDGVLVCPGATADSAANARPDADRVAYTLAFPKGYDKPLRNCRVVINGREYRVMGDPQPCRENCPTAWWERVEVERVDG